MADLERIFEPMPLIVAAITGAAAAFLFFKTISEQSQDDQGNITHSTYVPTMVALQGAGVGIAVQLAVRITGVS